MNMSKTAEIAIVNYGMGNIRSIENALARLSVKSRVINSPEQVDEVEAFILPGVGAFAVAMQNLHQSNMLQALKQAVMVEKKPLLGICLGMQLLAEYSAEHGLHRGLGWINARTVALSETQECLVPHVGWNNVEFEDHLMFQNVSHEGHFYFDHGFHIDCDPSLVIAQCEHGESFVAAIQQNNIMGTQFHPEKSQQNGLQVLSNFVDYIGRSELC